jgi:hypothetical protein
LALGFVRDSLSPPPPARQGKSILRIFLLEGITHSFSTADIHRAGYCYFSYYIFQVFRLYDNYNYKIVFNHKQPSV